MHLTAPASPQTTALVAILTRGQKDIQAGRYQDADAFFAQLDREDALLAAESLGATLSRRPRGRP